MALMERVSYGENFAAIAEGGNKVPASRHWGGTIAGFDSPAGYSPTERRNRMGRSWEDAVNAAFIEKVGTIIAEWNAEQWAAHDAMDELAGLYNSDIGELPDLPE